MTTRTLRIKTYYAFDANGHCGSVQAKTRRAAEKLIRQRITDGRPLRVKVSPHNCPECGGDNFGICAGKRCEDCGHTVE